MVCIDITAKARGKRHFLDDPSEWGSSVWHMQGCSLVVVQGEALWVQQFRHGHR